MTPHLNRVGSDEGSQHMVSMRNKKNCHQIPLLIQSSVMNMIWVCHIKCQKAVSRRARFSVAKYMELLWLECETANLSLYEEQQLSHRL